MRRAARLSAALWATVLLTGCGEYLGEYTVEAVHLTTDVPLREETSSHYGDFLAVRLVSETNLTALGGKVGAIYVDADFCPFRNPNGLIAFGPFDDDGKVLETPSAAPDLQPGPSGKFEYWIYVPVAYHAEPATKPGQLQLPTYDLRRTNGDVCLRLFAPGYNVIKSRSQMIRVPADLVSAALSRKPGANGSS